MVEGAGVGRPPARQTMLYRRPDLMHRILAVTADAVAGYLNAQIEAGAQAVMIFDSWGGVLADGAFQAFSLAYTRRACSSSCAPRARGRAHPEDRLTKGGGLWLADTAARPDVIGLDWTMNLGKARALVGPASRCRATSIRTCSSPAPSSGWPPRRSRCSTATDRRTRKRARLQPRPRHQPAHAAGERGRARGCGACTFAPPATRALMAPGGRPARCQPYFPDCPQAGFGVEMCQIGPGA